MNKIWILSPWIWYHSHTGEKLIGKLMQSPSTTAIHGVELLQFSKRQIFLSTGVQLEGELAWRWWGALVASVFSRRPNSRSFFHWLRLTFSRAECFNTNCNAGCGLFAPWRRGSRVSEELGVLPHQVADDRDLEGSSDPEKVSQPCYFKELPRWEVGPWQFMQDLTLLSWWIC